MSPLGEESITDFFLLTCRKRAAKEIRVRSFTRQEEFVTGADWEWWFTGPTSMWLGLRVQAKCISFTSDHYPHLHYKRSDGTYQADQLISDAIENGVIPAVCLYSHWEPRKYRPKWRCGSFRYSSRHYGIALVSAFAVQRLRAEGNKNDLASVGELLCPLHCLLCCSGYGGSDLPTRSWAFLHHQRFVEIERYEGSQLMDQTLLRETPPYYVAQLLDSTKGEDFVDFHDKNLKRVTIYEQLG
jgi:hypothetical protein